MTPWESVAPAVLLAVVAVAVVARAAVTARTPRDRGRHRPARTGRTVTRERPVGVPCHAGTAHRTAANGRTHQ